MVTLNGKKRVLPQGAKVSLPNDMEHRDDLTVSTVGTADMAVATRRPLDEIRCGASVVGNVIQYDTSENVDLSECEVQDALILLHYFLRSVPPAYRDDARRALQFLSSRLLEESLNSVYRLSSKTEVVQRALTFIHDVFQVCFCDHGEDWYHIKNALVVLKNHFDGNSQTDLILTTDLMSPISAAAVVSPQSCSDEMESTKDACCGNEPLTQRTSMMYSSLYERDGLFGANEQFSEHRDGLLDRLLKFKE